MAAELALPFEPVDSRAEEHAWVLAAQAGDRAAFGRLYERYARMVHGMALTYLSHDEAADLVQDVFVVAMERIPGLRSPAAFGGWLSAIARNASLDRFRRRHPVAEISEADPRFLRSSHASANGNRAAAAAVLATIRSLPMAYRETLILRLVEGLTGPEIAGLTGLTPDSVRVNLHRGMKLLREQLKGWQ